MRNKFLKTIAIILLHAFFITNIAFAAPTSFLKERRSREGAVSAMTFRAIAARVWQGKYHAEVARFSEFKKELLDAATKSTDPVAMMFARSIGLDGERLVWNLSPAQPIAQAVRMARFAETKYNLKALEPTDDRGFAKLTFAVDEVFAFMEAINEALDVEIDDEDREDPINALIKGSRKPQEIVVNEQVITSIIKNSPGAEGKSEEEIELGLVQALDRVFFYVLLKGELQQQVPRDVIKAHKLDYGTMADNVTKFVFDGTPLEENLKGLPVDSVIANTKEEFAIRRTGERPASFESARYSEASVDIPTQTPAEALAFKSVEELRELLGEETYELYLKEYGAEVLTDRLLDHLNIMYEGEEGRQVWEAVYKKLCETKIPHPLPSEVPEGRTYKHVPDEMVTDFSDIKEAKRLERQGKKNFARTHIVIAAAGLGSRVTKSIPAAIANIIKAVGRLTKPTVPIRAAGGESPIILNLRRASAIVQELKDEGTMAQDERVAVTIVISDATKQAVLADLQFMEGRYIDKNNLDITLVNQNEFPTVSETGELLTEIGEDGKPKIATNPNGTLGVLTALGETVRLENLNEKKDGAKIDGVRIARRVKASAKGATSIHKFAKAAHDTQRTLFVFGDDSRDKLLEMVGAIFDKGVDYMAFAINKLSMMVPPGGTFVLVEDRDPKTGKVIRKWISAYEMNQRTKELDVQEKGILRETGRCFYFNTGPSGCTNEVVEWVLDNFGKFPVHSAFKERKLTKMRSDGTVEAGKMASSRQGEFYLPEIVLAGTPELVDSGGNIVGRQWGVKLGLWRMDDYGAQKDWARILALRELHRKEATAELKDLGIAVEEGADVSLGSVFKADKANIGKNVRIAKGGSVHIEGECTHIGDDVKITFGPRGGKVILYGPIRISKGAHLHVDGGELVVMSKDEKTQISVGSNATVEVIGPEFTNAREVMVVRSNIGANTRVSPNSAPDRFGIVPNAEKHITDFAWESWGREATYVSYLNEKGTIHREWAMPSMDEFLGLLNREDAGSEVVGNMLMALALANPTHYEKLKKSILERSVQNKLSKENRAVVKDLINQVDFVLLYSEDSKIGLDVRGADKDLARLSVLAAHRLIHETSGGEVTGMTAKITAQTTTAGKLTQALRGAGAKAGTDPVDISRRYQRNLKTRTKYSRRRTTMANTMAAFHSEEYKQFADKFAGDAQAIDFLMERTKWQKRNFAQIICGDYIDDDYAPGEDLTEAGLFAKREYLRSLSGNRRVGVEVAHLEEKEKLADAGDGYNIGKRWLNKVNKNEIVIVLGRDSRPKAQAVKDALHRGVLAAAADKRINKKGKRIRVVNLGVCSTPMWEYAVWALGADGGVMVTASHNPPGDIGYKVATGARERGVICSQGALLPEKDTDALDMEFWGKDGKGGLMGQFRKGTREGRRVRSLINSVRQGDLFTHIQDTNPDVRNMDELRKDIARGFFIDYVCKGVLGMSDEEIDAFRRDNKDMTVALDTGGGGASEDVVGFKDGLEMALGVKVEAINDETGQFLRQIEPVGDATEQILRLMCEKGIKLGAIFDCDADRANLLAEYTVPKAVRERLGRGAAMDIEPQLVAALTLAMRLSQLAHKGIIRKTKQGWRTTEGNKKLAVVSHSFCPEAIRWVAAQFDVEVKVAEIAEINVASAMREWENEGYYSVAAMEPANGGFLMRAINESSFYDKGRLAGEKELRGDTCRNGFCTIAFATLVQASPEIYLTWLKVLEDNLKSGKADLDLKALHADDKQFKKILARKKQIAKGDFNLYEITETFPQYYYRPIKLAGLVPMENQQQIKEAVLNGWLKEWAKYCDSKNWRSYCEAGELGKGRPTFSLPKGVKFVECKLELSEGTKTIEVKIPRVKNLDDFESVRTQAQASVELAIERLKKERKLDEVPLTGGWVIKFKDNKGRWHQWGIRYSKTTPSELNEIAESRNSNTEIALTKTGLAIFLDADRKMQALPMAARFSEQTDHIGDFADFTGARVASREPIAGFNTIDLPSDCRILPVQIDSEEVDLIAGGFLADLREEGVPDADKANTVLDPLTFRDASHLERALKSTGANLVLIPYVGNEGDMRREAEVIKDVVTRHLTQQYDSTNAPQFIVEYPSFTLPRRDLVIVPMAGGIQLVKRALEPFVSQRERTKYDQIAETTRLRAMAQVKSLISEGIGGPDAEGAECFTVAHIEGGDLKETSGKKAFIAGHKFTNGEKVKQEGMSIESWPYPEGALTIELFAHSDDLELAAAYLTRLMAKGGNGRFIYPLIVSQGSEVDMRQTRIDEATASALKKLKINKPRVFAFSSLKDKGKLTLDPDTGLPKLAAADRRTLYRHAKKLLDAHRKNPDAQDKDTIRVFTHNGQSLHDTHNITYQAALDVFKELSKKEKCKVELYRAMEVWPDFNLYHLVSQRRARRLRDRILLRTAAGRGRKGRTMYRYLIALNQMEAAGDIVHEVAGEFGASRPAEMAQSEDVMAERFRVTRVQHSPEHLAKASRFTEADKSVQIPEDVASEARQKALALLESEAQRPLSRRLPIASRRDFTRVTRVAKPLDLTGFFLETAPMISDPMKERGPYEIVLPLWLFGRGANFEAIGENLATIAQETASRYATVITIEVEDFFDAEGYQARDRITQAMYQGMDVSGLRARIRPEARFSLTSQEELQDLRAQLSQGRDIQWKGVAWDGLLIDENNTDQFAAVYSFMLSLVALYAGRSDSKLLPSLMQDVRDRLVALNITDYDNDSILSLVSDNTEAAIQAANRLNRLLPAAEGFNAMYFFNRLREQIEYRKQI